MHRQHWTRVRNALGAEWRHLTRLNASSRPWEMPLAAALASGAPLLAGAWFGRLDLGLVASLGGLVFLNLPDTRLEHRMVLMMALACGMTAYGLAVMFITPLTIFLAEAGQPGQGPAPGTLQARVPDIALGSLIGLAGGAALHIPMMRLRVARGVRAVLRART